MRKDQKTQADNFIKVLKQAHDQIREFIESQDIENVLLLLQECQEGAIALGNMIEQAEGEGFITVSILEEYCESVYQIHDTFSNGEKISANKAYKILNQLLVRISNSVRNDIKVKKEVVFLPYKASMWDSLESVWRAANDDPDYNVYVVPIPYYDKNPDGSFGKKHYEGNLYPKYVQIVSYDSYDLETRRPDIVYIHNPYDECNYVTSVEPRFYAKNLKNYTDKLVYIPYFVLGEIDPDNQAAVDSMKHFIWTPGVIYADKVIVQSEQMKQIYVNEYLKAAKECGLTGRHIDRKYLEQKISGAGSPKLERVLRIKKEDLEIPPDWRKIIRRADGTDKKVIFYNTSVKSLLEQNEKMLQKMERAFEVFKEHREDVALLWRPHPLIPSTIRAMRPHLWPEYCRIVDRYRQEGWGIYDDSADVDRAVILSDAYYGDWSSVVQLCKKREIPIMIQNVDV